MADWTEKTDRPGGFSVPAVTEAAPTARPPVGAGRETVDSDTGLPYTYAGDTESDEVPPSRNPEEFGAGRNPNQWD